MALKALKGGGRVWQALTNRNYVARCIEEVWCCKLNWGGMMLHALRSRYGVASFNEEAGGRGGIPVLNNNLRDIS